VAVAPGHHETGAVTIASLLTSILNWLRAGYPEGVPGPDRVGLLALLRATPLTEDQVREVVRGVAVVRSVGVWSGRAGHRRRNGPGPRLNPE
jgi:hypothetical protein